VTLKAVGPVTPATNAGGAASFTWSSEATYGLSRQGSDPAAKYMPLYRLKQPRPKFWEWPFGHRGDENPNDPIDRWVEIVSWFSSAMTSLQVGGCRPNLEPSQRWGWRTRNLWCRTLLIFLLEHGSVICLSPTGDAWWLWRFQWWLSWVSVTATQTLHIFQLPLIATTMTITELWSFANGITATPLEFMCLEGQIISLCM
jgi:hypothetical protein